MAHPRAKAVLKHPVRLAESESMAVDLCPCGTLQLHLGALTLRFDIEGLARVVRMLGAAMLRASEMGVDAKEETPAHPWRRAQGDA